MTEKEFGSLVDSKLTGKPSSTASGNMVNLLPAPSSTDYANNRPTDRKSIIAFQKENGLTADGVWGDTTQAAWDRTHQGANAIDSWVRTLPSGLSESELNTYIYSNSDLSNNNSRDAAAKWYRELYGLPDPEAAKTSLPPLSDSVSGLSGGMNEGEVRQHLKGLGYESADISDGWKLYDAEYGYDPKKASPRAQNLAVRFPNPNSPAYVRDAWLQEVQDAKDKGYLTKNDLNWLLAMAEGWGGYYG